MNKNENTKRVKDLTSGKPLPLLLGFGLPIFGGILFQQFYNLVDTMIVGKMQGVKALAAVGSTGSINFLIVGFCIGICNGFAIPIAQRFGAGDFSGLRRYIINSIYTSAFFAVTVTCIVCLMCRQILIWMKTPSDIIDLSASYIFIIFLGIPATILYNMASGIIRSFGNSKTPLYFLIFSSVLNIILDLLLIRPMGVRGAALATIISQAVSGVIATVFLIRHYDFLKPSAEEKRADRTYIMKLCSMGLPMGLQYSITAIGSVILQSSVNQLGSDFVASSAAAIKVNVFLYSPLDALGSTMATFAGQNVGAGKLDRVDEGIRDAVLLGFAYSVIGILLVLIFARQFALLFVSEEEVAIIANIRQYLMINNSFMFLLTLVNVVRFTIQGLGFSGLAIFAGVGEMIARAMMGFFFVPVFGYVAACFASPVAWLLADLFLVPAYLMIMKRLRLRFQT
ncbi:MAG: MATE family efflux transporter [Lachnospiraceae bacterium]|nr:MATE family efflux transporter [Lachnospiraceae bacterium]